MAEQERSLYWDDTDSCKSIEHEGLLLNQHGTPKRLSTVLFHIMTKRLLRGWGDVSTESLEVASWMTEEM